MSKLFFRSHSNFSSLFLLHTHTLSLSLPVWNRKKSRKRSGSVIVVRCVFVGVGGVTTREEMKKCDDEWWWWEWDRAFVSFSLLLLLFCACKKNKKILIKTLLRWILMTGGRGINFCLTETKAWKKKRDSLMREKERKEERREPFVAIHDKKNCYIELSSSSSSSSSWEYCYHVARITTFLRVLRRRVVLRRVVLLRRKRFWEEEEEKLWAKGAAKGGIQEEISSFSHHRQKRNASSSTAKRARLGYKSETA